MTLPTSGTVPCGDRVFDAAALLVRRSRRRAHLGGRSVEGKTQATFARLQLEHGDCLSQRTLRLRHMTQLRNFEASVGVVDGVLADASELALFSEPKALAPALEAADPVIANICDMLQLGHGHCISSRLTATLSLLTLTVY